MFQKQFGGAYLYGHDYRAPKSFVGKRTFVVGAGNSACDMATKVCSTAS